MDIFSYLLLQIINGFDWKPEFSESKNYKNWIAILDLKTCPTCRTMHGKIWRIEEKPEIEPEVHNWCRCEIKLMVTVKAGTATTKKLDGADWTLKYESKLPDYYISREKALENGWKPSKWLSNFAPDKILTIGEYFNDDNHLPYKEGRTWHEADINYNKGKRNSQRILWSNDGLVFITYDHYKTFFEIV